jgi:hypothetical protein
MVFTEILPPWKGYCSTFAKVILVSILHWCFHTSCSCPYLKAVRHPDIASTWSSVMHMYRDVRASLLPIPELLFDQRKCW